ncbi:VOC family protein [Alteromonas sp. ASW11-19]|uniref:VOC family protein n=1 Tax=Alteromonas salexigens TaxID=2982530 RepID=A0ABT2VLE4_9ALTE|nr:VOC family protein [Alteromonas salexigens]MCU7553869.1 VOC family protein [Alteromonas salexigens]
MDDAMWLDMTVDDADRVSRFYERVMGWSRQTVEMDGYVDYVMIKPDGSPAGGICHKRGSNSALPGGWIPYFTVANLTTALNQLTAEGGEQISEVRAYGDAAYCIIRDPAGACCALYAEDASA